MNIVDDIDTYEKRPMRLTDRISQVRFFTIGPKHAQKWSLRLPKK
jgi:hypothetical protein